MFQLQTEVAEIALRWSPSQVVLSQGQRVSGHSQEGSATRSALDQVEMMRERKPPQRPTSLQSMCSGHTCIQIVCTIAPSGDFGYQIVFPWHHITQETTSPVSRLLFSILISAIKINVFCSAESKNSRHGSFQNGSCQTSTLLLV